MSGFLRGLRELVTREPVIIRTVITTVVSIGLIWGVDLTDLGTRVADTADLIGVLVAAVGVGWVRQGVTPASTVVATKEPSGAIVAGPASNETTGSLLSSPRHMS